MSLSAKNGTSNNKTKGEPLDIPEKGTHMARVVGLIDLGHQPAWEWQGETIKDQFKITFTYEFPNSLMEDGRPHWVSEDVNVNDFEGEGISSTMMKRVRAIDNENDTQNGQDLSKLLGKPCMVTIDYNAKGYPKIKGVSGVPMGMSVPDLNGLSMSFDMDSPDLDVYATFSDFVKDKISKALNFESSGLKDKVEGGDSPY